MNDFQSMQTTQKGTIGEAIVRRHLEFQGAVVYTPTRGRAHLVDFFVLQDGLTAADVKTYPRMYTRPVTGIDARDFEKYRELCIEVELYFVDEVEGLIYSGLLSYLELFGEEEYGKVLFPLAAMTPGPRLQAGEVREIREHSGVDYSLYANTRLFFSPK